MYMKVNIYCLYNPITSKIRYIGRTKSDLNKRLQQHICKAKNNEKYYPNTAHTIPYFWKQPFMKGDDPSAWCAEKIIENNL